MTRRVALAPLLAFSIACSDVGFDQETASLRTSLINCTTNQLGLAPLLNSCGIGWIGPFGDDDGTGSDDQPIAANANVAFTGAEPALHAPQLVYTVNLPGNAGTGAVKFVAASSQDYSVVTDVTATVVVRDSLGAVVTPLLQQDIEAACDAAADTYPEPPDGTPMVQAGVYPLTAGATYSIAFQNSSADEFHVAIDEPNDFLNVYFPDADGDGFGNYRGSPVVTECSAPGGYATNGDDCNDSNGAVFPGAPEVPGMGDNNCDTVPDGDVVATDLAIRDVVVLNAPAELALEGRPGLVEVRYRYVNRGTALMDATVTMTPAGTNVRILPGQTSILAEDLMPVRIEEHVQRYKVKCKKPKKRHDRHHHHRPPPEEARQPRTLTFTGEIQPADPADVDPQQANNVGEATLDITCVDCSKFERCDPRDHHSHRHGERHGRIPAVCRKKNHDFGHHAGGHHPPHHVISHLER